MPEPVRQPLAIALRDAYPWADLAALARTVEDGGFDALFLPEVGARDTLVTLAALAGETSRIRLGTGVVPVPSSSGFALAPIPKLPQLLDPNGQRLARPDYGLDTLLRRGGHLGSAKRLSRVTGLVEG